MSNPFHNVAFFLCCHLIYCLKMNLLQKKIVFSVLQCMSFLFYAYILADNDCSMSEIKAQLSLRIYLRLTEPIFQT